MWANCILTLELDVKFIESGSGCIGLNFHKQWQRGQLVGVAWMPSLVDRKANKFEKWRGKILKKGTEW